MKTLFNDPYFMTSLWVSGILMIILAISGLAYKAINRARTRSIAHLEKKRSIKWNTRRDEDFPDPPTFGMPGEVRHEKQPDKARYKVYQNGTLIMDIEGYRNIIADDRGRIYSDIERTILIASIPFECAVEIIYL